MKHPANKNVKHWRWLLKHYERLIQGAIATRWASL